MTTTITNRAAAATILGVALTVVVAFGTAVHWAEAFVMRQDQGLVALNKLEPVPAQLVDLVSRLRDLDARVLALEDYRRIAQEQYNTISGQSRVTEQSLIDTGAAVSGLRSDLQNLFQAITGQPYVRNGKVIR